MSIRRVIVAACAVALVTLGLAPAGAQAQPSSLPPVRTVFVVNLENKGYDETFGPNSPATYLNDALRPRGVLLTQYYGTAHASLGNYIAQVSGQGPDAETQSDCQFYSDFTGAGSVPPQQAVGQGCVYPASVQTLPDQLAAQGLSWKGYMEDMGNSPTEPSTCRHPALNTQDQTQLARPGDQYAARHNPFVYFHSIIDSPACSERVVPLDRLEPDLAPRSATPNLVYITPNLCNDGHDAQCVDGRQGGLVAADQWLATWIPKILDSRAFKRSGMLIVTFDESEANDASACCGEGPGPNSPLPGITGMGGGRTGAVVVSPFTRPGGWNDTAYNHYSLLCSIEELFGLPKLGYAGQPGLRCFGTDLYTKLT